MRQGGKIRVELKQQAKEHTAHRYYGVSMKSATCKKRHFNLQRLVNELKTYIENQDSWTEEKCELHWKTKMAQLHDVSKTAYPAGRKPRGEHLLD